MTYPETLPAQEAFRLGYGVTCSQHCLYNNEPVYFYGFDNSNTPCYTDSKEAATQLRSNYNGYAQ